MLKGHIALARAVFPRGVTGSQLDILARKPLWEAGLDYDHGTGHGVGSFLGVHEGPARISKIPSGTALAPGMILSNEPGYYKPGAFGIRIENLVVVVQAEAPDGAERPLYGFETLTLAPIDRRLDRAVAARAGRNRLARRLSRPRMGDPCPGAGPGDAALARTGVRASHPPAISRQSCSLRIATPSSSAFRAFDPASLPTTT